MRMKRSKVDTRGCIVDRGRGLLGLLDRFLHVVLMSNPSFSVR